MKSMTDIMRDLLKDNLIFFVNHEKREYWENNKFKQFEIYNFTKAIKLSAEQVEPLLPYLSNNYVGGIDNQSVVESANGEVIFKERSAQLPSKYQKNYPVEKNIWPKSERLENVDENLKTDLEKNKISKLDYFKKVLDAAGIKYEKISEYSCFKDQHSIPETWEFDKPLEIKISDILPMFRDVQIEKSELIKFIARSIGLRDEVLEILESDDFVIFHEYPKVGLDEEIKRILSEYEFQEYKKNPYEENWVFEFKCRLNNT